MEEGENDDKKNILEPFGEEQFGEEQFEKSSSDHPSVISEESPSPSENK